VDLNYIIFYQAQRDNVYFVTSTNSEKDFLKYPNFLTYINKEFKNIANYTDFIDAINKFEVVILYETGVWEIIREELNQKFTHQQLYELNKEIDKKKSKNDMRVETSKNLITNISNTFRKQNKRFK